MPKEDRTPAHEEGRLTRAVRAVLHNLWLAADMWRRRHDPDQMHAPEGRWRDNTSS